jgi:uncharacterized protein (DUF58 family)
MKMRRIQTDLDGVRELIWYSIFYLIPLAIFTGIADYYRSSIGIWYSQNWVYFTVGVALWFLIWFLVRFWKSARAVQVSGTISERGAVEIAFVNLAGNISTTVPITNGAYSVTIVGGQTYAVAIVDQSGNSLYTGSLDVPSGVTTFHADF